VGTYLAAYLAEHIGEILGESGAAALANLKEFAAKSDYTEYGGAPLLGVEKVAIISHGSSNAKAIANAIRVARETGARQVNRHIAEALAEVEEPAGKESGG
jgi:glycerol-3-phosphate acyltransferase PlsX